MKILFSKPIKQLLLTNLKCETKLLIKKGIKPCLTIITTSNDYASKVFINQKKKICNFLGIKIIIKNLKNANQLALVEEIKRINNNKHVHGILVQLPTNKKIVGLSWTKYILTTKDVDCFHPDNLEKVTKKNSIKPCVVEATLQLLKYYKIITKNKKILIINKDKWIGYALKRILETYGANVTIIAKNNHNILKLCQNKDIVISAIGKPNILPSTIFNNKCIIIDIGTSYNNKTKKIAGDVDFNSFLLKKNSKNQVTPVPGGIGPLTTVAVANNLIQLIKLSSLSN